VEEVIKFRPHHFLCTLGFQGHGYSLGFVKNYKKIVQQLSFDENTLIEVVGNMDSICFACPNKVNESLCTTQSKITQLDSRHQQILGLKIGEILSCSPYAKTLFLRKFISSFIEAILAATNNLYLMAK